MQAGEQPIQGVTIRLQGAGMDGSVVDQTTTTDANGQYCFTRQTNGNLLIHDPVGGVWFVVPAARRHAPQAGEPPAPREQTSSTGPGISPGTYTVTETQPAGFAQGTNTFGSLGGVVSGDAITGIVVSGTNGTGYNFGEIVTPDALHLTLTKSADKATYSPGDTITYTYVVTNNSPITLRDVLVTDDNATPWVISDDFTVGTVSSLASGASKTFTATRVAPSVPAISGTTYPLPVGSPATSINLTTSGASGAAGAGFVYQTDTQPTGTGYIRSFVRFEGASSGGGFERGVNTDARPVPFDENSSPQFTRSLTADKVPVVTVNRVAYREFLLDINQSSASSKLSIDDIRIFLGTSPALVPTSTERQTGAKTLAGLSPVYDLDAGADRTILLDARLTTGSGSGDMVLLVPDSAFAGAGAQTFVYLYSKMGATAGATANGGFEEWAVRVRPALPPVPSISLTNTATAVAYGCEVATYAYASATVTVGCPTPPGVVKGGDTATIGFWNNKNGQALIKSLNGGPSATNLANWLATNFPYLYGPQSANNLTGKKNLDVAALFQQFFAVTGPNTDAQVLAGALAVYVTDSDLAGTAAAKYGFTVTSSGTGAKTVNVGAYGSEIGLQDNGVYTVFFLLQQANLQKKLGTFDSNAFNAIFDGINQAGDIK